MSSRDARWQQPAIRQTIRTRLLIVLLSLTTISVLALGYLGVNSVQSVGEQAQQIGADALRTQAEEYLRQITQADAQQNDLVLRNAQRDAENVAQYATTIFDNLQVFAERAYWQVEDRMYVASGGQFMNDETDTVSVLVPDFIEIDEGLIQELEASAYIDLVLAPTYASDPNTVAVYLGTEQEITRYYPNISLGALVPPDFQITQRPWYVAAAPANNPQRNVVWSPIYVDATGQGLMVTASAPVYTTRGEFVGVIGIDVTLEGISASIEAVRLLGSGYSFLVDATGRAIALPAQGYRDILGRDPEPGEVGADLSEVTPEFAAVLSEMLTGATGFDVVETSGRELFVAYAPLESTGWSLANVVEAETVLQALGGLQAGLQDSIRSLVLTRILPVAGGILAGMTVIGLWLARRVADPIRRIATAAQQIGAGEWDVPLPRAGNDEIGVLSRAFATMTDQLRDLVGNLEQRVAERTVDLKRRSTQMEAAAKVAREAAEIRDVTHLLEETVRLISDRFGFYHAGIFLFDEKKEYAVLQAASSEGGQQMLKQGHRLRVGETGIVGYVTHSGQPRISLDVGSDAVYFDNPFLPQTRSEIALPLQAGGRIIGALDVQSKEPMAFDKQDVAALQTMADQLAVAIENARLLEQMEQTVHELEIAYGQYTQQSWHSMTQDEQMPSYRYRHLAIEPTTEQHIEAQTALRAGHTIVTEIEPTTEGMAAAVAVPIRLREQTIGVLDVHFQGASPPPETVALIEEVASRMALTLESAQLYRQTQRRAAREQIIRQITEQMRRAVDVEAILHTTVAAIGEAIRAPQTYIRLGTEAELLSGNGDDANAEPLDEPLDEP